MATAFQTINMWIISLHKAGGWNLHDLLGCDYWIYTVSHWSKEGLRFARTGEELLNSLTWKPQEHREQTCCEKPEGESIRSSATSIHHPHRGSPSLFVLFLSQSTGGIVCRNRWRQLHCIDRFRLKYSGTLMRSLRHYLHDPRVWTRN